MRRIWPYLFFLFILSCDETHEKYLYDEDDPEHPVVVQMAAAKCISSSSIFGALEDSKDFTDFEDKIYKIEQDANEEVTLYVKLDNATATSIDIMVNSAEGDYKKVVTFTEANHDDMMTEIQVMACNSTYDEFFSVSGLSSTDLMTLTWTKETIEVADDDDDSDDDPEAYVKRTDEMKFDNDYPLFFYWYNGSKEEEDLNDGDENPTTKKSNLTITEVTDEDECDPGDDDFNTYCDFSDTSTSNGFDACTVNVNTSQYTSNEANDELISLASTSGECELLESAD